MTEEYTVETGQFSSSGQNQAAPSLVGYFEPGQFDQRKKSGRLYLVADGVGGAGSGQVAGRYAIQKILHDFYHTPEPDLHRRLRTTIKKTNAEIFERNKQFPDRRPTATTLMVALIHESKLWVAGVGDGQVYVVWDQDIEQLKRETSPLSPPRATFLPPEPATSEEEPGSLRQQLPTGLGLNKEVKPDTFSRRLFPGDTVVLATGGLTGYVTEKEIAKTVSELPPRQASRRLADLAMERGSRDPISVSVSRLVDASAAQSVAARPSQPAAGSSLPPPPDWEKLSKPVPRPRPVTPQPLSATTKMAQPAVKPPRPRRRPVLTIAALILVASLGLIAFLTWRYWLAPDGSSPAVSDPNGTAEVAVDTGPLATPTGLMPSEQTGSAASDSELIAESNSPLATPSSSGTGGSMGEVISPLPTPTPGTRPTPTITPTPLPTIALPADCTNKGRFASDITVRDGQEMAAGEAFEKIWAVTNYGTCPWGPGYTVRFVEGDRMDGTGQPLLDVTEPEETGEVAVKMVAPAVEGTYQATWQMYSLENEAFGPELYVEVKVVPGALPALDESEVTVLYNFVENAAEAAWLAGDRTYAVTESSINEDLVIPFPQGIVAVGPAVFGGDYTAPGAVLLTHPHQELGFIEGSYRVETPVQPEDLLVATLGFPKAAIINDDGATFAVSFKPDSGPEQPIFSKLVQYEDTPTTVRQPLANVEPGQSGAFIIRVEGGDSLSYDWATWIELTLVRP